MDPDQPTPINVLPMIVDADVEGVDIIASAVLEGARNLDGEAQLQSTLLDGFSQLVWLLRQ